MFSGLYFSFLVLGTLVVLSGSSWFVIWVGLEVNMLAFIPVIGTSGSVSSEAVFKYFLVQALGSLLLFFIGLMGSISVGYGFFVYDLFSGGSILIILVALKLGASPVHFWFPAVMEGLDWFGVMLLMTWQKIAPLGLLLIMGNSAVLLLMVGVLSVIVGGFGGLNQLLMRKLLAYSSISHLGWMCCLFVFSEWVGSVYFLSYALVSLAVVGCLLFTSCVHVGQLYVNGLAVMGLVGMFYLGLFSLGGLPPLFGFFPKWVGILCFIDHGYMYMSVVFVFIGLLTLYFYIRIGYGGFMFCDGVWLWGGVSVSYLVSGVVMCGLSYFLLPFVLIGWL